jgi:hypothetical protein
MVVAHETQSSVGSTHINVVSILSLMKEDRSISFLKRQAMYEQCNIEVRSHYHRCSRKLINITYNGCVSVALVIQHVKCLHHIVISGLSSSTIFFHIISLTNGMIFWGKKIY